MGLCNSIDAGLMSYCGVFFGDGRIVWYFFFFVFFFFFSGNQCRQSYMLQYRKVKFSPSTFQPEAAAAWEHKV